jgi:long-subunit fatty acid transport protein
MIDVEDDRMKWVSALCAAGTALLTIAATPAFAQSNDEVFPQFQFNFSTPGARANAMGRAFIGLADDASASITNPAGLVRLTRRQAYFEFKTTDLSVERLADRRSLVTLDPTTFGGTFSSPAFLSVSMPLGDRYAFAFTRHQFLNYQEDFSLEPRPIPETDFAFFGVDGESNFQGVSYSGSLAMTVNDRFRVGVTISFDQLSAESVATRFDFNPSTTGDRFDLQETNLIVNQTEIDDTASGVAMNAGVLWLPNEKLSVGLNFAKGSRLEVSETLLLNPSQTTNQPLVRAQGFPKTVSINVPNRLGFGAAYRPTSRLLAAFDVVHIGYSSLVRDFTLIFDADTLDEDDFELDDAVEVHAGGEFLLLDRPYLIFVRAGVQTSPAHITRYRGAGTTLSDRFERAKYNLLAANDEIIGTAGVGIAIGARFQADFAVVFGKEFVGSAALRF